MAADEILCGSALGRLGCHLREGTVPFEPGGAEGGEWTGNPGPD